MEMLTGEPLFPGDSDVDQLWLILKCMGQLPPAYAEMLSCNEYFVVCALPPWHDLKCSITLACPFKRSQRLQRSEVLLFIIACCEKL